MAESGSELLHLLVSKLFTTKTGFLKGANILNSFLKCSKLKSKLSGNVFFFPRGILTAGDEKKHTSNDKPFYFNTHKHNISVASKENFLFASFHIYVTQSFLKDTLYNEVAVL